MQASAVELRHFNTSSRLAAAGADQGARNLAKAAPSEARRISHPPGGASDLRSPRREPAPW
ncbi:MAG: hypothetical protein ACP5H5_10155, partial [Pyrobaculum sp.]